MEEEKLKVYLGLRVSFKGGVIAEGRWWNNGKQGAEMSEVQTELLSCPWQGDGVASLPRIKSNKFTKIFSHTNIIFISLRVTLKFTTQLNFSCMYMAWVRGPVSFSFVLISSWISLFYQKVFCFSTYLPCQLCNKIKIHVCVGLFLGFQFCYIIIFIYLWINTMLL